MKYVLVISDTHCGSDVGLMPMQGRLRKGNYISAKGNSLQEWLWYSYSDAITKIKKKIGKEKCDVIINGDATEGVHHRNDEILASTIMEHAELFLECIKPIQSIARKFHLTLGTECHTHEVERYIADKLDAATPDNILLLENEGVLIEAKHHIGTTGRKWLEASAMSIYMNNAILNYVKAGHRVPSVFLRGHRHVHGYYSDDNSLILITGGWQGLTRYGHKVVPDSMPCPSIVLLEFYEKNKLPIVHTYKYEQPQRPISKI